MRRAIYVGTVLGLLIGLTVIGFVILKEIRDIRNVLDSNLNYEIPELEKLSYYDSHKLKISSMNELSSKDGLFFFYSDDCSMCKLSKEDIAAFVYYGLADKTAIYFVDINENPQIVGEALGESLEEQKIYATPTMLEIKNNSFKKYEGVEEIFNLLNSYAQM